MIEQQRYPIESVPKYNFSDVSVDGFGLPDGLAELCLLSLRKLQKQQTGLTKIDDSYVLFDPSSHVASFEIIPLCPVHAETSVVGVDVSSIRIGETVDGVLLAIRGAVVWNVHHMYHYLRLGPFIFHVTENNKKQIFSLLRKYQNDLPIELAASDFVHLQTRIASVLERWIQLNLCSASSNTLILLDGSLTAGTPDAPESVVAKILQTARTKANTILAFSKFSRIRFNGQALTEIALKGASPCLVKVDDFLEGMSNFKLLGNVYVARFSDEDICFRLDVDRDLQWSQVLDAVQKLVGNDVFHHGHGYPETLRLAHIYSTFTANEVIGMQRYLEHERELKISVRPNIRRLLFGPFGKGPEV
ncbi:MAG TPA: hypothetical protein VMS95_03715 [Candidatus Krumholzibacteriaceae bacterium]|nr:hypothetical protein [Candidatus Krumholzibacteriaceae bacterium]